MNRLAQDSNVAADRTKATAFEKLRKKAESAKEEIEELKSAAASRR
jgi:predicted metalloendopeptidase